MSDRRRKTSINTLFFNAVTNLAAIYSSNGFSIIDIHSVRTRELFRMNPMMCRSASLSMLVFVKSNVSFVRGRFFSNPAIIFGMPFLPRLLLWKFSVRSEIMEVLVFERVRRFWRASRHFGVSRTSLELVDFSSAGSSSFFSCSSSIINFPVCTSGSNSRFGFVKSRSSFVIAPFDFRHWKKKRTPSSLRMLLTKEIFRSVIV